MLEAIVLRGISLSKTDRHASMEALLVDLEHDPAPARRRRRRLIGLGMVLLIVLAAGARWYWSYLDAQRVKVSHFQKVVYRRGAPVGVGKLSKKEVEHRGLNLPGEFRLQQNYPNPLKSSDPRVGNRLKADSYVQTRKMVFVQ